MLCQSSPLTVENQIIIIYAVINDYLKDIAVDRVPEFEKALFEEMATNHSEIIDDLKKNKVLSPDNEEKLKAVLKNFAANF